MNGKQFCEVARKSVSDSERPRKIVAERKIAAVSRNREAENCCGAESYFARLRGKSVSDSKRPRKIVLNGLYFQAEALSLPPEVLTLPRDSRLIAGVALSTRLMEEVPPSGNVTQDRMSTNLAYGSFF